MEVIGQLHAMATVPLGKEPLLLIRKKSGWASEPVGCCGEDRLLGLRVRIPPGESMSVSGECCVLQDMGLCDRPIPRTQEAHRL